jgi:hypothetical protein
MLKSMDKWLPGYLRSVMRRPRKSDGTRHLLLCIADHFEPFQGGADLDFARAQVVRWQEGLPKAQQGFIDSGGFGPRHTFFYPQEDYQPEILDRIAELCHAGHGETEVHLHHHNDTAAGFREKLVEFRDVLHRQHSLLGLDASGRPRYAFIHGNWALCNSRPDGAHCGVNAELGILADTGCYVDMTFPSAPSSTQPRTVNAIYYAKDRAFGPGGGDCGTLSAVGGTNGPGLLMIQGPLALNWGWRKYGVLPRLENADITATNPVTPVRSRLWARQGIHVKGHPEWVFVKVHTHGCDPRNRDALLDQGLADMYRVMEQEFVEKKGWCFHYVSAREMTNIVHAAERGERGDPTPWRDVGVSSPL